MKNIYTIFILFISYNNIVLAQAHNDAKRNQTWLVGGRVGNFIAGIPAYMDFTHYPMSITYQNEPPHFYTPYASGLINTPNGRYLFYTNSSYAYDSTHQVLVRGDTLIPPHIGGGGWAAPQGTFILPYPRHQNQYYITAIMFSNRLNLDGADRIVSAVADFNRADGRGELINRGVVVHDTTHPNTGMGACRHANGRDWWLIGNRYDYSNGYNRYLLDPTGMKYVGTQRIGPTDPVAGGANSTFSPDGIKYAIMDAHFTVDSQYVTLKHLKVFDFDRCTGLLSNAHEVVLPLERSWTVGIAFSPNARFVYIANGYWIYQYDTQTQQMQTIATFDGFQDPESGGYAGFGSTYLAADGKVYIATPSLTHYLHVINNPDSLGAACGFEARGVYIPNTTNANLPNMPYFALGAVDGTVCDSLGYNAAHFASLRIEPYHIQFQNVPTFSTQTQTITVRNIGDTTLIIQNPAIQQGIYTINLPTSIPAHNTATATISCTPLLSGSFRDTATVISNAIVRKNLVFLEASSVVATSPSPSRGDRGGLRIYPNPTHDILNIEIEASTSPSIKRREMNVIITNTLGIQQKTLSLQSEITKIPTNDLANGIYFISIYENNKLLNSQKFVVLHE